MCSTVRLARSLEDHHMHSRPAYASLFPEPPEPQNGEQGYKIQGQANQPPVRIA